MAHFPIKDLLKSLPILLKAMSSGDEEEEDSGYESPTEELDVEEDFKENLRIFAKSMLPNVKLRKLSSFGNLITGYFKGDAVDRLLFGSPTCKGCENKITINSKYYRCFECDSYIYCFDCFRSLISCSVSHTPPDPSSKKKVRRIHLHNGVSFFHPVRVSESDIRQKIKKTKSSSEALVTILQSFSSRFFLGKYTAKESTETDEDNFGSVEWISYRDILKMVIHGSTGFRKVMNPKQKRPVIGLVSELRYEGVLIDFISIYSGCIFVPIQRTIEYNEKKYIIEHSEINYLFTSSQYLDECLLLQKDINNSNFAKNNLTLEIILLDLDRPDKAANKITTTTTTTTTRTLRHLLKIGRAERTPFPMVVSEDEDVSTIIYTSGSTGDPKGVVFTEKAWKKEIKCEDLPPVTYLGFPLSTITYSPFSHYTGRIFIYHFFSNGGRVALCDDISKLFDCSRVVRPVLFGCVPRILVFLQKEFQKEVKKRLLLKTDDDDDDEQEQQQQDEQKQNELKRKRKIQTEVMREMRNFLGDRLRIILTFGAPISTKLKKLIRMMLKCVVLDSYGMTEFGSVAVNFRAVKGVHKRFKLVDCPEKGYFATDEPFPRGEICVRRKEGITGYYKNEEATREKWGEDGWYRTGDIAELRENDKIVIIDRISNVVKLSQGEFVSLEKIENILTTSEFCSDIFVYSKSTSNNLVALVVIRQKEKIKEEEEEEEEEEECEGEDVVSSAADTTTTTTKTSWKREKLVILEDLKRIGKKRELRPYEIPVDILLSDVSFSIENGMLTNTGKKKRKSILKEYGEQLSDLLDQSESFSFLHSILDLQGDDDDDDDDSSEKTKKGLDQFDELTFFQLGGDSISALFFINEMSKRGKVVRFDDLLAMPISHVISLAKDADEDVVQKTMVEEKDEVVKKIREIQSSFTNENKNDVGGKRVIFVTGASGYLGEYLIKEIIDQFVDSKIICLVRKKSKERLLRSIEGYSLKNGNVVEVAEGDLSQELLGMGEEEFEKISSSVDCIVHNGAYVNHLFSYDDLYSVNVRSIFDIIRMARGKARILYVSSVAVYLHEQFGDSKPTHDILRLGDIQNRFYGYGSTKWVVDQSLRETCPDQVITFRPALIGWSGIREGHERKLLNETDWLIIFLKAMIRYRRMPELDMCLDLVSADFVAYSMIRTLRLSLPEQDDNDEKIIGRVFDLSMDNVTMNEIFEVIEEYYKSTDEQLKKCSVDEFLEIAKKNKERKIVSFSRFLRINFEFFIQGQRMRRRKRNQKEEETEGEEDHNYIDSEETAIKIDRKGKFNPELLKIFGDDERFLEEVNEEKMLERMSFAVRILCEKIENEKNEKKE